MGVNPDPAHYYPDVCVMIMVSSGWDRKFGYIDISADSRSICQAYTIFMVTCICHTPRSWAGRLLHSLFQSLPNTPISLMLIILFTCVLVLSCPFLVQAGCLVVLNHMSALINVHSCDRDFEWFWQSHPCVGLLWACNTLQSSEDVA